MINDETGYIKLAQFTNDAGKEVADAMIALEENPGIKNVILDVRGNPGGLLHEATNICECFYTHRSRGGEHKRKK
jgi:carboxyl-terminal processing protease